jgi:hypothetical protein
MSRLVGTRDGLSAERAYVWRTLPRGVLRGLGDAVRGDWSGLGRAWAIVSALAVTGASYALGAVQQRLRPVSVDHSIVAIEPARRVSSGDETPAGAASA